MPYQLLADTVLALHFGVVVFVVGGLLAVLVGHGLGWRWVNRRGWRLLHLVAVVVVAAQAWLGVLCPLTTLESWLRAQAGGAGYGGSFVQHWLQQAIYFEAPFWVFTLAYTVFGVLVLVVWRLFPPEA